MKLRLIAASMLIAVSAYGQGTQTPIYNGLLQSNLDAAGFKILTANMADYAGTGITWNVATGKFDTSGGGGGGTVTSITADFPITITPDPTTTTGMVGLDFDTWLSWDTAYADRLKWNGGATGLTAATGRTSLGLVIGTDVEAWLGNPSVNGYVLSSTTAGVRSWIAPAAGGGTPGGSNTQVQFNDSSAFGGDSGLVFNKTTDVLSVGGQILGPFGSVSSPTHSFTGSSTGLYALDANAVAMSAAGNAVWALGYSVSRYASGYNLCWGSGDATTAADIGLSRTSAGVLKVNDGGAGTGIITGNGTVPTGGTSGQVLKKSTNTNYDYAWAADATGAGGTAWGTITGTLSAQTDLQTALDAKLATAGDLAPLFTTTEATQNVAFSLTSAAATTVFGRAAGTSGAPTYSSAPQFLKIGNLTTNGFVKTGSSDGTLSVDTATYLTANQNISLTGDVTGGPSATSIATTIGANKVTLGMMATMATDSILGRATASTGNVEVLSALPFAYTGDVTRPVDSNVTTLAAGNAGNLNSGTLLAARMPALTGEVTTTAGAVATTIADGITVANWTLTTPQIAAISNLTTNGFVKTGGAIGTLSVDTSTYLTSTSISDTAYAGTWDTVTTIAPSKNAVYDKIETLQPLDSDLTSLAGISGVRGDVIFYGASGWTRLGVGTNGNQLTTHAAGADPTWDAPGAGGGSGDVVGPVSSVASEIALFDGLTGKLIKSATGSGLVTATSGVYGTTTNNTTNWDLAFTQIRQWDGGSTGLVAATGRTSLALNNVTNDAQTKSAIVPNTAPATGQVLVGNAGATAYAPVTVSGSGATITMGATGVLTISAIANASLSDADLTTWAGITPGTNVGTFLATPSSANLRAALTDENGTGAALFSGATAPDFTTGFTIGAAAASGKILVGNGTNYVPSTPTFPATASATSRKFIVSDGTNWVASTETQAVPGTSGNVLTSDGTNWLSSAPVVSATSTTTFTNKRINPRVVASATGNTTPTPDVSTTDQYNVIGMTVNMVFGAPTGTPVDGQRLIIRIEDSGSVRTIGWNAAYRIVGVTLPTTTVAGKLIYVGCIYNSTDSVWDVIAVTQEA